jgi:hypothetical protein
MGKGYAERPANEERFADLERAERGSPQSGLHRRAVFGATADDATPHFLRWADEVDADALSPPARDGA